MLKAKRLHKSFQLGGSTSIPALRDVSLSVREGEFVTVVGSNGAGKSSLLNAVSGTISVTSGTITLGGADVTHWPEHKRARWIGRIFQDPLQGTAARMTIEENLAVAKGRGRWRGLRRGIAPATRRQFREALAALGLGLEDRLTDPVGLLSGGQRQALTLLMATLVSPKLLLLDEHTAALDPKTAEQILELTAQLIRRQKLTALMVTHNLEHALRLGDRTLMMHEGEIVLDISGENRSRMTVKELLDEFSKARGESLQDDRMLFSAV